MAFSFALSNKIHCLSIDFGTIGRVFAQMHSNGNLNEVRCLVEWFVDATLNTLLKAAIFCWFFFSSTLADKTNSMKGECRRKISNEMKQCKGPALVCRSIELLSLSDEWVF